MHIISLINHSAELVDIVLESSNTSNKLINQYLRKRKYIGSKDRRFINECLFHYLRNLLLINSLHDNNPHDLKSKNKYFRHCLIGTIIADIAKYPFTFKPKKIMKLDDKSNLRVVIADNLIKFNEIDLDSFTSWYQDIESMYLTIYQRTNEILNQDKTLTGDDNTLLQTGLSIKPWIIESWKSSITDLHSYRIAESLNLSADIGIRVANPAKRENILKSLNQNGINSELSSLSPSGIVVKERYQLTELDEYRQGLIEIQDIGSQLISFALSPADNWRILDACAGAGGKSLHLASLQNDRGDIVASDIEYKRLKELPKRSMRLGYNSFTPIIITPEPEEWDEEIASIIKANSFDAVLVDAPCSGMGTCRRSPMVKWNLSENKLLKLQASQLRILTNYSKFVKIGGILVYATCSLMPQENEQVINSFLNQNSNFKPDTLEPVFNFHGIKVKNLSNDDYCTTLNPYDHQTDGFFIARMKRID